jgi:hypothetical protein
VLTNILQEIDYYVIFFLKRLGSNEGHTFFAATRQRKCGAPSMGRILVDERSTLAPIGGNM